MKLASFAFPALAAAACCAAAPAVAAETFSDGGVHNISRFVGSGFVRDSAGGQATTLNALAGAEFSTLSVNDTSIANFFVGSLVTQGVDSLDASRVTLQGGTFDTVTIDALDQSTIIIGGGDYSASSTQLLRAFDEARLTINGGSFLGGQSSVLQVLGDASVVIHGGAFAGVVRSGAGGGDDGGRLDIFGGSFTARPGEERAAIVNTFDSVITFYGQSFNLPFGEITTDFTGALTGVMANGDTIDVDLVQQLNNADTGKIVLVQSPVPEPTSVALLGAGLALLLARGRRQKLRRKNE